MPFKEDGELNQKGFKHSTASLYLGFLIIVPCFSTRNMYSIDMLVVSVSIYGFLISYYNICGQ